MTRKSRRGKRSAFTSIEFLSLAALIAFPAGLRLPA